MSDAYSATYDKTSTYVRGPYYNDVNHLVSNLFYIYS